MPTPHILVVDDELDTRDGCQHILSRMGYPVFTAARGSDALPILADQPISIVLLDLKMPGMDGMELLRRIQEHDLKILIIVITGYATVETAIEAMKRGAYDFIAKPFDPEALRIVVRRAHERIRLTTEAEAAELERRKTLTDLLTEKSRTRTIIQSLPTGVVVTNAEDKVVLANPAFFQHVCLDPDLLPGERIEDYVREEGFCRLVHEIAGGRYTNPEAVPSYEFSSPCGKDLLVRGRPIIGESGENLGAVLTVSDVTALRALDKLKSAFVAEVSHELRSPLSTIHEQLALVIRDLGGGDSAADLPILNRALAKTHDLIALVGDLLDLSRIESGSAYRDARTVDLEEVLSGILSFLQPQAEKRGQSLALEVPAGKPPRLVIDPFALESIFGNLVANALNYTQEGGSIRIVARPREGGAEIEVVDNGMGIAAEHLPKIFDRFYRVRNAQTRAISGTGLGLPIVKGLIDGLGGSIGVESTPGRGSRFSVFLPSRLAAGT